MSRRPLKGKSKTKDFPRKKYFVAYSSSRTCQQLLSNEIVGALECFRRLAKKRPFEKLAASFAVGQVPGLQLTNRYDYIHSREGADPFPDGGDARVIFPVGQDKKVCGSFLPHRRHQGRQFVGDQIAAAFCIYHLRHEIQIQLSEQVSKGFGFQKALFTISFTDEAQLHHGTPLRGRC